MSTFEYAELFMRELAQKYAREMVSNDLTLSNQGIKFLNAQTIKIPRLTVSGYKDHNRNSMGFNTGTISNDWEPKKLEHDRDIEIAIDPMDIDETTNNVGSAAKKAAKQLRSLMGFDQINKLDKKTDTTTTNNKKGTGTGSLGGISALVGALGGPFANGGYVKPNTPQLAMIGDNKHQGEVVAPEGKMLEMARAAAELSDGDTAKLMQELIDLIKTLPMVRIDPETLRKYFIEKTNQNTKAKGRSELVY